MSQKYDLFYTELKAINDERKRETSKISGNQNLSKEGKAKELTSVNEDMNAKINDLKTRFKRSDSESYSGDYNYIHGRKKRSISDHVISRARDDIKDYDTLNTDDMRSAVLVEQMEKLTESVERSTFQNIVGGLDLDGFKKVQASVSSNNDVKRLGWLKGVADMKADHQTSKIIDVSIETAKDTLDPKRSLAKARMKMVDFQNNIFDSSIKNVRENGEYFDHRNGPSQQGLEHEISTALKRIKNQE